MYGVQNEETGMQEDSQRYDGPDIGVRYTPSQSCISILSSNRAQGSSEVTDLIRPAKRTSSVISTVVRIYAVICVLSTGVADTFNSSDDIDCGKRRAGSVRRYENHAKKGG